MNPIINPTDPETDDNDHNTPSERKWQSIAIIFILVVLGLFIFMIKK